MWLKLAPLAKSLATIFFLIQGSYLSALCILGQFALSKNCESQKKLSCNKFFHLKRMWIPKWKLLLPGPLYLIEPRKKTIQYPKKLNLTIVVECWNLCIMHLWRNMQIRAILVLCLSMLILHSHPANSHWVEIFSEGEAIISYKSAQ